MNSERGPSPSCCPAVITASASVSSSSISIVLFVWSYIVPCPFLGGFVPCLICVMDSLHQRQKPENGEIITDNRVLLPQKKTKKN